VITVVLGKMLIVEARRSWRVLETASPPTYYLDANDFAPGTLQPCAGESWCEWKGSASYFDLVAGSVTARQAAWYYPNPSAAYRALLGHVAVYPAKVDRCTLDGEEVQAQDGDFYGGWITSRITGPFKGAPGTLGW
jgi:uncharacterized protein (DUF427 family)